MAPAGIEAVNVQQHASQLFLLLVKQFVFWEKWVHVITLKIKQAIQPENKSKIKIYIAKK